MAGTITLKITVTISPSLFVHLFFFEAALVLSLRNMFAWNEDCGFCAWFLTLEVSMFNVHTNVHRHVSVVLRPTQVSVLEGLCVCERALTYSI